MVIESNKQSVIQQSIYSSEMLNKISKSKVSDPKKTKKKMTCKVIEVMILIISIPLQVALSNFLQEYEISLILQAQKNMNFEKDSFNSMLFNLIKYLVRMDFMVCIQMIFFMCTDSLLAYKATFCYCIGSVMMTILKLVYREPRPYWTNIEIQLPQDMCDMGYGNPT